MIVVSDTSPVRYLVLIDCINALPELVGQVILPPAVYGELTAEKTPQKVRDFVLHPPPWMSVRSPAGVSDEELFEVDAGEREAILLAEELNVDAIMIDDRDGRVIAERRGLRVLGTLGFLEIAHREGKLNFIDALLDLKAAGFYVHRDLEISFLHRLGFN